MLLNKQVSFHEFPAYFTNGKMNRNMLKNKIVDIPKSTILLLNDVTGRKFRRDGYYIILKCDYYTLCIRKDDDNYFYTERRGMNGLGTYWISDDVEGLVELMKTILEDIKIKEKVKKVNLKKIFNFNNWIQ